MDIFVFVLVILALIGIMFLLSKMDTRTKNKYKTSAYEMLETSDPDRKQLKECIKGLRLYGGRIKKDKEARELITRLLQKHGSLLD